ncbi:MAG: alcohol dehydrogenase [Devosia sp.]|uniref:zinc-dependent alcohol dehydrogenase family protein n=1 Tax=Devosia sp. TaxID=1871048 RepID=UPI0026334763|nr:zinc-dependent alcohol dehydrogenase family protein [Devosia sp.]MDB5527289.1 alcohol dehydrogenase [Devosia sp.]
MRAIQLNSYGDPIENVDVVDIPEPAAPGPGEVLVGMEYAPVNPADLLLAMGYYTVKPALPSVIGNEGVGTVLALGVGVTTVKAGDRVVAPLSSFTWRERMLMPSAGLVVLPPQADPQQLAMLAINPVTAQLILAQFEGLRAGDWIVQNAANSGVGRSLIAFSGDRGLKTINIVRRAELIADLEAAGGDVVVVDGPDVAERIKAAIGSAEIKFGLDGVSGAAAATLASLLANGGTLVSYGAMSNSALSLNPADVVFKQLKVKGLFLGDPAHVASFLALIKEGARLIAAGKLNVPVAAIYPLSAIKQAIAHVQKGGKVLLDIKAAG